MLGEIVGLILKDGDRHENVSVNAWLRLVSVSVGSEGDAVGVRVREGGVWLPVGLPDVSMVLEYVADPVRVKV